MGKKKILFAYPMFDFCAKEIFSNEIVRKYFICDVLHIPMEKIRSVQLANTFLWKRYRSEKHGFLDILVELNDDTKINIEVQIAPCKDWEKRNLFYLAKMYTQDLLEGERYGTLKKCICISILDFNLTDLHRMII